MTACTTPVAEGMSIENEVKDIVELRKAIIELLFVEGNHFCPACEKSGNCELQALAYRFRMLVPRFPYLFPVRKVDASHPRIIKDQNRCVLCKRCIRAIRDENGKSIFAYRRRSSSVEVVVDPKLGKQLTDELAQKAMDVCPVGSIIVKEKGFITPIGERKYDNAPIGSDVENMQSII
jgi:[NiFe] hydrogenase diaphorase moiety small subunit